MRNEIQRSQESYLPAGGDEPWNQLASVSGGEPSQQQSLKRLHRLFRGRYLLAIALAAIFGMGGALIGFFCAKPEWRSVGLVQIDPVIPNPGSSIDVVRPMWEQFIRSQEAMIQSQDVIITAMGSDEWRSTKRGMTPTEINDFVGKLDVAWLPGTSLIRVSFTDPDKSVPQLATKSVILAYQRKFADQDTNELTQKLNLNDSKRRDLERQLKDKQDLIISYGQSLGTDTPEQYVDQRIQDYGRLQAQLNQSEIQYTIAAQQLAELEKMKQTASTRPSQLSVEQMTAMDPRLAELVGQRDQQQASVDMLLRRYLPNHPQVLDAELRLHDLEARIKERADMFRKNGGLLYVSSSGQPVTPQYVESLKIQTDVLKQKVDELGRTTQDLGRIRLQITAARNDVTSLQAQLKDVEATIERLNTQRSFSNKIRIASYGDTPYVPIFDKRKQYAAMGLVGGAAIPVALLLLIGLIDTRYRYSDDAAETGLGGINLLGILPNLPDLLTDPDQAAIAAHCVHQIRTMLQLNGAQRRQVFAVTSAAPGDGKTSLSLALGLSFAASGSRTLLIDCDLVGGGLTARLNMSAPTGVLEAINTRTLMEYVRPTDIADLTILPLGDAHTHHASSLSPAALQRLVDEARKHFDTVLVDTGPIQGSIEASSVCAAADAVVLVVARGQQRPQVDRAMAHLRAIGAKLAGVVFNRAQSRDFDRSVNRLSLTRSIARTKGHGTGTKGKTSGRFGPVAKAVATSYTASNGNDPVHSNDQD
jgi:capsular exopolysaccharide synthesis family protein